MSLFTEVITKELVVKELNQCLDSLNQHPGLQVSPQKRKHMNNMMSEHIGADEAFARVMYAEMFGTNRKAISIALSRFNQQTKQDKNADRLRAKLAQRKAKA